MNADQIEDVYTLTPNQQGILFHAISRPGSGLYLEQWTCTARDLDTALLRRAWQKVIDRHPALRTTFHWEGLKQPVQVVHRRAGLPFIEEDWRGLCNAAVEEKLAAYLRESGLQGDRFTEAPLMRLASFRTGASEYRVAWTIHHLIHDSWSIAVMLREVAGFYDAERTQVPYAPEMVQPYRNFVAWRKRLQDTASESFWRDYLLPCEPAAARERTGPP